MKLRALTSLRFFAALGVFLDHFFQLVPITDNIFLKHLNSISSEGYIWVGFFFILSGFIISFSFDKKATNETHKTRNYLLNRFCRIYPVHIIMIIAFFYFITGGLANVNINHLLTNLLLIQSWIPETYSYFGFNAVSWSISDEAFFYISFIFLVKLNSKYICFLFLILLSLVIISKIYSPPASKYDFWIFYINPLFRLIDFVAGMLVYHLYKHITVFIKLNIKTGTSLEILSILIMIAFISVGINLPVSQLLRNDVYYILPMAIIILVFSLDSGLISRIISNKYLIFLGEASFCFYMVHQLLNGVLYGYFYKYWEVKSTISVLLVMFSLLLASITISSLMYILYEKPANNFLRSVYNKKHKSKTIVISN